MIVRMLGYLVVLELLLALLGIVLDIARHFFKKRRRNTS